MRKLMLAIIAIFVLIVIAVLLLTKDQTTNNNNVVINNTSMQITSPVFNEVEISLDAAYYPGSTFTIKANNNSPENIYIQSMRLNGEKLDRYWISHGEIVSGGILELEMGPEPKL